jgi:hypothetical protein
MPPGIECLHDSSHLREEPRLRRLVWNQNELVVLGAGFVTETDPCVFHGDSFYLRERELPV